MSCAACRAELPDNARFCPECGAPTVTTPVREVRKTVTLLFTDVTGSTALGEQLDPEAYRGVMGRYFEVGRAAVERHGGLVEKFVGDAVLAVFGVPEVREDDALRAVRAARDLTRDLAALSRELEATLGVRLEVRTGVNTGSVVTGDARAGGSFATGDAVNTAARLEQAAPPGQVLIGEETHALVRDAVVVEAVEPVTAKGKAEPLSAYRLLEVHETDHGRRRRHDTRLVGRDRETRVLVDALERTLETGRGHLVTVVGAPGIGKSRLVADFLAHVGDRAEVLTSRCVSYGQGITFWPVVQMLRQALGLAGSESDEVTRHALDRLLAGSADGPRVASLLLAVLGKGGEAGSSDDTFWAVRRALEQLASRRPLVVTVDDLHWAEPTLLELIERVRDEVRDLPLLLVCQARPELLDEHPQWGGGSLNSTTFGLEPFSEQQTTASLAELLGDDVAAEVGRTVAGWAGGNPLFVEEVAAHLVDRGLLELTSDGWVLTGDLSQTQVPPTVAALLAARLDRLPERELRLVERISVVGLEVTSEDAVFLSEGVLTAAEVPEALATLVHRDLLQRRRSDQGETWAFRHILLRDAAYESLPKALRADLHERFADRVEGLADELGPEWLAFMGHHLERSLSYRRELARHDPGLDDLLARTVTVLSEAADLARDREDLPAATSLLRQALDLHPAPVARRAVLVQLGQLMTEEERVDDAQQVLDELAETMDETATEIERARQELLSLSNRFSASDAIDPAQLEALAARCTELARAEGDERLLSMAHLAVANCSMMRARWSDVASGLSAMAAVGRPQDIRFARLLASGIVINGSEPMSALDSLIENDVARGGRSPGDAMRLTSMVAMAGAAAGRDETPPLVTEIEQDVDGGRVQIFRQITLGIACQLLGDLTTAIRCLDQTVEAMLVVGDLSHASTHLAWAALLRLEVGDEVDQADRMIEQADEATSPYDVISVALVAAGRGLLAARQGRHDEAHTHLSEAIEVVDTSDQLWQAADIRRWAALAARLRDDADEERRLLVEALELYRTKEIVVWARVCEERLAEL